MAEVSVSGPISGTDKTLTLSTGVYAPQSQGAVVAKLGKTQVLATANGAKEVRELRRRASTTPTRPATTPAANPAATNPTASKAADDSPAEKATAAA